MYMKSVTLAAILGFASSAAVAEAPSDMIVREAREAIGARYRWGAVGERVTDCAGLVRRVAATAGVELPRRSSDQYRHGKPVKKSELRPGDLVFFKNTYKRGISHVGIYIGDGEFIHAASRRKRVVVDRLDESYFSSRFAGARRVVEDPPPVTEAEGATVACEAEKMSAAVAIH
jgi:cell wall-associated NlpC family hydrolase